MTTILAWYAAISVTLVWICAGMTLRKMLRARAEMRKAAVGMMGLFSRTSGSPGITYPPIDEDK